MKFEWCHTSTSYFRIIIIIRAMWAIYYFLLYYGKIHPGLHAFLFAFIYSMLPIWHLQNPEIAGDRRDWEVEEGLLAQEEHNVLYAGEQAEVWGWPDSSGPLRLARSIFPRYDWLLRRAHHICVWSDLSEAQEGCYFGQAPNQRVDYLMCQLSDLMSHLYRLAYTDCSFIFWLAVGYVTSVSSRKN